MQDFDDIQFEWDENKNRTNLIKHRVSFEEAQTVFNDIYGRLISDPDHSEHEDRFILLGRSDKLRLLSVCHGYKERDIIIRIITARKAAKKEIIYYQEQLI